MKDGERKKFTDLISIWCISQSEYWVEVYTAMKTFETSYGPFTTEKMAMNRARKEARD